jgi:hypothetical protein
MYPIALSKFANLVGIYFILSFVIVFGVCIAAGYSRRFKVGQLIAALIPGALIGALFVGFLTYILIKHMPRDPLIFVSILLLFMIPMFIATRFLRRYNPIAFEELQIEGKAQMAALPNIRFEMVITAGLMISWIWVSRPIGQYFFGDHSLPKMAMIIVGIWISSKMAKWISRKIYDRNIPI